MDLSDGLADAVTQVAAASGTGAEVDLALLPYHASVPLLWPDDAAWQALVGGDDYELLFAVRPRQRRAFFAALGRNRGVAVTRIGRLTPAAAGCKVRRPDGSDCALPRGYEHFGRSGPEGGRP
jgi:thiamine-monophosphate kinase